MQLTVNGLLGKAGPGRMYTDCSVSCLLRQHQLLHLCCHVVCFASVRPNSHHEFKFKTAIVYVVLASFSLSGGHSGLNIHEGRGNAVQLMARTVRSVLAAVPGSRLVSLAGGDKR